MIDKVTRAAFADELYKIASWGEIVRDGLIGSPGQGVIGRGIGIAGTAMQARQGLKSSLAKEDPSGRGRSRFERTVRFGGEMVGGILGSGLASRALANRAGNNPVGFWKNLGANVAGGIAGGMVGSTLAGAPFALKRRMSRSQQMVPPQQPANNPAPGGAHSPDAITGQAQAM